MLDKKQIAIAKVAIGLAVPLILWWLPESYFDQGQPVCFSRIFFGQECFGCGTTRSMMRILHGEFAAAWELNPLGFAALPAIALFWVKWLLANLKEIK